MVGGFLGSGKSTAILETAHLLVNKGQRVGIITNEQGKHLVDTAFLNASGMPALEVTGGCICCNLDDFEERVAEISTKFDPQVLFVESVGSCADLVATVIKPLADYHKTSAHPASLSVFTDSRLLLRFLRSMELPFSEGIVYIFEKQIEEASLLIANKIDLLSTEEIQELIHLGAQRYPEKHLRPQNSLDTAQVAEWLALIQTKTRFLPNQSLNIDYDSYAAGEGQFAWVDREYMITFSDQIQIRSIADWVVMIAQDLEAEKFIIAHMKFLITHGVDSLKFNLTSQDGLEGKISTLTTKLDRFKYKDFKLILNLMVEGDTSQVGSIIDSVFQNAKVENLVCIEEIKRFSRTPGYPKPSLRIN